MFAGPYKVNSTFTGSVYRVFQEAHFTSNAVDEICWCDLLKCKLSISTFTWYGLILFVLQNIIWVFLSLPRVLKLFYPEW